MPFSPKPCELENSPLYINDVSQKSESNIELLRFIIDDNINFVSHVYKNCTNAPLRPNALSRVS